MTFDDYDLTLEAALQEEKLRLAMITPENETDEEMHERATLIADIIWTLDEINELRDTQ